MNDIASTTKTYNYNKYLPKVSVIIPTFNRSHSILQCIYSAINQTYSNLEIIVIDDASTDETYKLISTIDDLRLHYIKNKTNLGGAASRNVGINYGNGEFVAFLDSDDIWYPEKLEKQMMLLTSKGDDYGFVFCWFNVCNGEGKIQYKVSRSIDGLAVPDLLKTNCIGTFSNVLAKKKAITQVHGIDNTMPSCQDWELFIKLNAVSKICCVNEYLLSYTQNNNDKIRISCNRKSVIIGHRKMLCKIQHLYPSMDRQLKLDIIRAFVRVYVGFGGIIDIMKLCLIVITYEPSTRNIKWFLQSFLKACQNIIAKSYNY